MIELNIQAMVHMTYLVMPKMVEKKRGIVINLSSASAIKPAVMMNVYGSTKVCVCVFVFVDLLCYNVILFRLLWSSSVRLSLWSMPAKESLFR